MDKLRNIRYFFWVVTMLLPMSILHAQQSDTTVRHSLKVLTRYTGSAIEIRWAPTSRQLWNIANTAGYKLERRTGDNSPWQQVALLKPYTLSEWKSKTDTGNVYVATAAQALLGKTTIAFKDVKNIQEALRLSEEQDAMFAFGLLAADYNKQAAEGLALRFDDKDIVSGKAYTYRLYIHPFNTIQGSGIRNDTLVFTVLTNTVTPMPEVRNVNATQGDGEVILTWDRQFNDRFFSGYWIEKSLDNGKSFQRLNDIPHNTSQSLGENTPHIFRDTNVVNYKQYQYRIIGLTPFAVEGRPSEALATTGIDLSGPLPPQRVRATDNGKGTILIEWDAIVNTVDHAGFLVERALNATGPYELVTAKALPKTARSFIDKSPVPVVANYYIVYAADDKGNRNGSAPIVVQWLDTIPPSKPKNLGGTVDSNGIVTLAWDIGDEPDLLGYRVFFSNARDREFYQVTSEPVKGSVFFDSVSLNTLSRRVYYYIVAVDRNYNPSQWSDILELTRPDIIPPQAPVITRYSSEDEGIMLTWNPSTSSDVIAHSLYRRQEGDAEWKLLKSFGKSDSSYLDADVKKGSRYGYSVSAKDEAGLESPFSNILSIDAVDNGVRPGLSSLTGQFIKEESAIQLRWEFEGGNDCVFKIMRSEGDDNFSIIAMWVGSERTYKDRSLYRSQNGFKYQIVVLYPDGGESLPSNQVIIGY